jgi:hypothetical protein
MIGWGSATPSGCVLLEKFTLLDLGMFVLDGWFFIKIIPDYSNTRYFLLKFILNKELDSVKIFFRKIPIIVLIALPESLSMQGFHQF